MLEVFLAVIAGLLVGSMLNVIIYRLPIMQERETQQIAREVLGLEPVVQEPFNLNTPRSHCPSCGHQLSFSENMPVIPWLLQRGKCRSCGSRISLRYPLVELSTGLIFGLLAARYSFSWEFAAYAIAGATLLTLAMIDVDHQILPDELTLPLLWLGMACAAFRIIDVSLFDSFAGAAASYLFLFGIMRLYAVIRGAEGMGQGDAKLLAALAAWLGIEAVLPLLLIATATALVVLVLFKKKLGNKPFPFGPYLAVGAVIVSTLSPAVVSGWLFN